MPVNLYINLLRCSDRKDDSKSWSGNWNKVIREELGAKCQSNNDKKKTIWFSCSFLMDKATRSLVHVFAFMDIFALIIFTETKQNMSIRVRLQILQNIHLDKSLAYSSFKVQKLNARKIFQKHKTDSQFTDSERKHVVAKNKWKICLRF